MGRQETRHSPQRQRAQAEGAFEQKQKLLNSAEVLLVKKDLKSIWTRSGRRALLVLLPVMLVVVVPAVYFVLILLMPEAPGARLPEALTALLPEYVKGLDYKQGWLVAFTDLLCPMLFLCVPILTGAASASYAFVMERESGTLETLLLTSMGPKSVFNAKTTSCTVLSVLISGAGFLAFALTVTVADVFAEVRLFFTLDWLILLVLEMPTLSLFSVVFVALTVTRVHSTVESLQTMGYLILPVAAIYLMQLTGIFRLNFIALILISIALGVLDVVFFNAASRGFTPEKLLERGGGEE